MIRFLAYTLFGVAFLTIGTDMQHFWDHGVWSWHTVGMLLNDQGIVVDSATAPLTHEFLLWMTPVPLGVVAAAAAAIVWMMQPRFIPKVIADLG